MFEAVNNPLYQIIAFMGGFILLFGLVSLFVKERLYLAESLVATVVGIIIGPTALEFVNPSKHFQENIYVVVQEIARIVISFQVMAVGVAIPRQFMVKAWKSIIIFLGPVMVVMWLVSAVIVKFCLDMHWLEALIIAACVTPTDPVLAHSVIKGKFADRYIPNHLRNLLAIESGANDGLGFPFLMLPILLIKYPVNKAIGHWFLHTWLYEIILSIIIGFVCGFGARFLLFQSEKRKLIDKESFLVFSIALTMLISGLVALISSDDLLAVFIAGNAFAWDDHFTKMTADSHLQEVIDMIFNMSFFVLFGAIIPWQAFVKYKIWRLCLMSLGILVFRRLPIVWILKPFAKQLRSQRETFFAGWFGPMGVGAIFFAIVTRMEIAHADKLQIETTIADDVFPVVTFVVISSIFVHGFTVPITNFHLKSRAKRRLKKEHIKTSKIEAVDPHKMEQVESAEDFKKLTGVPEAPSIAPKTEGTTSELEENTDIDDPQYFSETEQVKDHLDEERATKAEDKCDIPMSALERIPSVRKL